jgi:hypothetical protein
MTVYKHSGSLGASVIVAPALATVAALLLSLAYAYIDVWSPIAGYISILFVAGFGFGLMVALRFIARLSKCRSPAFMGLMGTWTALLSLYASWGFFLYALLARYDDTFDASMLDVLASPGGMWAMILQINDTGWYSIKSLTPSGGVLWFFWGIEALIIVGAAVAGGLMAIDGEVFCERCMTWCDDSPLTTHLQVPDDSPANSFSSGNIKALEALTVTDAQQNPHFRLSLKHCSACDRFTTAQLALVRFETNDKGEVSQKSEDMGPAHVLSADEVARVKLLASTPPAMESLPVTSDASVF